MKTCTTCGVSKPLSEFYVRQAKCKHCAKVHALDYYAKNKDKVLARMKSPKSREAQRARDRERSKNPHRKAQQLRGSTKWRKENPQKRKEVCARWNSKATSKALNSRRAAKRRAVQLQATPIWVNQYVVNFFYTCMTYFRTEGIDVHVDHIVPLQGKNVCGLHIHQNLQLLLAPLNHRKSNKF